MISNRAALTLSPALQYDSHDGPFTVWDIMHALIRRSLACFLIMCILAVGGFASAQSITHEFEHAHHQKSTHGTVLCSWMCAAGTVLDSAVVPFQAELSLITLITLPRSTQPSIELCQTSPSRAPPPYSL